MANQVQEHLTIRESKYPMISIGTAIKTILNEIDSPPSSICYARLNECGGRILSKNVHSSIDLPRCATSIMDGYALNYDLNYDGATAGSELGIFKVVNTITAGNEEEKNKRRKLGKGEVIYVTTGSALSMNADCVIKIEDTEIIDDNTIKILSKPKSALQFIRSRGSDISRGQLLLEKGTKLLSSELGILASVGVIMVPVYNKIRVTILSTGDELTDPFTYNIQDESKEKQEYETNLVFDSNKLMLQELLNESLGNLCIVMNGGIIGDNKQELKKHILLLLSKTDILITSGGVSMGARDFIKPILSEIGDIKIGRVCIKPGKPMTFATVMVTDSRSDCDSQLVKKLVFGLPGNPVSTNVCFKMFVEPAIKKYSGIESNFNCQLPPISVEITKDIRMDPNRPNYQRCVIYWDKGKNKFIGVPTGSQRSSRLLSCKSANCLLRIPQKSGILAKGTMVKALVIGDLIPNMPPDDNDDDESKKEDEHEHLIDCDCGKSHAPRHDSSHSSHASHASHSHSIEKKLKMSSNINIGVLTVSDRASKGIYSDKSGPILVDGLKKIFDPKYINSITKKIVADDFQEIENILSEWDEKCDLIITSGGTGFGERDITPEVTKQFIKKDCQGIVFKMMQYGLQQTKFACLSRYLAGISQKKTLIINMPGSTKAVTQCLEAIKDVLPHAINQIHEK